MGLEEEAGEEEGEEGEEDEAWHREGFGRIRMCGSEDGWEEGREEGGREGRE